MIMKYKDFKMLSRDDMKKIIGGYEGGTCTASCVNAESVSMTCSDCSARDNIGAFCGDGTKKCCYAGVPCFPGD